MDKFIDGVFLLLPYTKITIFQLLKQMVKNKIYQTQYDTQKFISMSSVINALRAHPQISQSDLQLLFDKIQTGLLIGKLDKKFWGGFDLAYMQQLKKENKG